MKLRMKTILSVWLILFILLLPLWGSIRVSAISFLSWSQTTYDDFYAAEKDNVVVLDIGGGDGNVELVYQFNMKNWPLSGEYPSPGSDAAIWGHKWAAQTFTAPENATISAIILYLKKVGTPGDLVVEFMNTTDGMPGTSNLTSPKVISSEDIVTAPKGGAYRVIFNPSVPVTEGGTYAVVLHQLNGAGNSQNSYQMFYDDSPGYSGGRAWKSSEMVNSNPAWTNYGSHDFAFLFSASDEHYNSGYLASTVYDAGYPSVFGNLFWNSTIWPDTSIKFQIATNSDNITWNFVGPDGLSTSYYETSGDNVWPGHNGDRYIKYKAYLNTDNIYKTPILHDVMITYNKAEIDIEQTINGKDADSPPGPLVMQGDNVTWSFTVTNTSNVELNGISVVDDVLANITMPKSSLAPGESMTVTVNGTAIAGQYAATATVSANLPGGLGTVDDSDPVYYFGVSSQPAIDIEQTIDDQDADSPPGLFVMEGDNVTWSFTVTNTSNVELDGISVVDDVLANITMPESSLAPGESMTATVNGTASIGQYVSTATVTANLPGGLGTVNDSDPAYYFGVSSQPAIDIEQTINDLDADSPTGPLVMVGDNITWSFTVTNTSNVELDGISVVDDVLANITMPESSLAPGESMTATVNGTAIAGQYAATATVTANLPGGIGSVNDSDPAYYFGLIPEAAIDIEYTINNQDTDSPPGLFVMAGDNITWSFTVTNTGNAELEDISVVDDMSGNITMPKSSLAPGESMTATVNGTASIGQYASTANVTANLPGGLGTVDDSDPVYYFGVSVQAAIDIEKNINGQDADNPPGPSVTVGDNISWSFTITNTSNVELNSISVVDTLSGNITMPKSSLAPGESMTATVNGTASIGQYASTANVTANLPGGLGTVTDSDSAYYFGVIPEPPGNGGDIGGNTGGDTSGNTIGDTIGNNESTSGNTTSATTFVSENISGSDASSIGAGSTTPETPGAQPLDEVDTTETTPTSLPPAESASTSLPPAEISPALFSFNNLKISLSQSKVWRAVPLFVRSGKEVSITVDINNYGGQPGSFTALLRINGNVQASEEITLDSGETRHLTYTITGNEQGKYVVEIGNLTGEFQSTLWINWLLIIILATILIGLVVMTIILRRRRGQKRVLRRMVPAHPGLAH